MREPSLPRSGRTAGFSLIELLAVLTVALVMAAVAAPAMGGMIRLSHSDGALDRLAADIAFARTHAVRSGRPVQLKLVSAQSYRIVVDPSGAPQTVRTTSLGSDYPSVSLAPAGATLQFDSRGLLTADPPAIRAVTGGRTATLTITRTGRAYRAQ